MPQPNKGSAGKPNVAQPVQNTVRPKPNAPAQAGHMFGGPGGKGTRGK